MFRLFKSKLNLAKEAYEACSAHRKSHLLEFRKNASREILLTYPDAKILSNIQYGSLLAYSKKSNVLITGGFADELFPRIEYIDFLELRPEVFEEAASTYRGKVKNFSDNVPYMNRKSIENPDLYFRMNTDVRSDFVKKGYSIYGVSKSDLIVGCKVTLDDFPIASSNCVNPQEAGYFAKKIYNEVVFNHIPNNAGISTLTLELVEFGYGEFLTLTHNITYDSRARFQGDSGFKLFNSLFAGLIEFTSAIEDQVASMPKELAEDPDGDWESFLERNL